MSFFAPVSTPVLAEGYTPVLRRAFDHARRVGNYAAVQAVVQLLAFTSGILLVRWLPQREYAYFTIANAMQATLNVLADIGISVGLISIGGRVWQDRHRFGQLINTGLFVRRRLAANDQRRARFVDEDRIDFIDNRVVVTALNLLLARGRHAVVA